MRLNETMRKSGGQRGVALLLSLGILSLLLILGMSFAFTARTERQAAGNSADLTRARLLAESGLERVMAYLGYLYQDTTNDQNLFPATKGAPFALQADDRYMAYSSDAAADTSGLNERLQTTFNGVDFVATTDIPGGATWEHMEADEPYTDSNSNGSYDSGEPYQDKNGDGSWGKYLIGRVAFLVIDESGKLDPTGVTSATVAEGLEVRKGELPSEINLANAFNDLNTGTVNNLTVQNLYEAILDNDDNYTTYGPSQLLPSSGCWFSWRHLFEANIDGASAARSEMLARIFPFSYDKEYFRSGGADVARFNLARTDWSSGPVTVADVTTGVPWLSHMVDGSSNSVANQVAANLIDYCDSDDNATTDYDGTIATYCGLEKVPYINEIDFKVKFTQESKWWGMKNTFTLDAQIELVNMYSSTLTVPQIEITADLDMQGLTFGNKSIALTWSSVSATPGYSVTAVLSDSTTFNDFGGTPGNISDFKVTNFKVVTGGGSPIDSTNLHDIALIGNSPAGMTLVPNDAARGLSVEVNDPRLNTSGTGTGAGFNWKWLAFGSANDSFVGSANAKNGHCSVSGGDTETASDPVNISTAYIRNAPMQSLWELGAIHRGEAWRTINLKDYTANPNGTYGQGDWQILDQVKLGSATEARGKVNVNTPVAGVWNALLGGITIGGGYASPGSGNSLTVTDISNLYTAITTVSTGSPFGSRGALVSVPSVWDEAILDLNTTNIDRDTDREQEEIIGKLANLLTVRQNYFTVIVVAQAVKDVGTETPTGSVTAGATNVMVLGEQKIMAVVYRDAFTNEFRIERYEYLE